MIFTSKYVKEDLVTGKSICILFSNQLYSNPNILDTSFTHTNSTSIKSGPDYVAHLVKMCSRTNFDLESDMTME